MIDNTSKVRGTLFFFVRSFNDIDHMTPLIWYTSNQGKYLPIVFVLDWNFDIDSNPNLKMLRARGVAIELFWSRDGGFREFTLIGALEFLKK